MRSDTPGAFSFTCFIDRKKHRKHRVGHKAADEDDFIDNLFSDFARIILLPSDEICYTDFK